MTKSTQLSVLEYSERRHCAHVARGALSVGVIAGVCFLMFPPLDLHFSAAFFNGAEFFGTQNAWVRILRNAFIAVFILSILLVVLGLFRTRRRQGLWCGLSFAKWGFVAICLAFGPGLIANFVLKDHWGRPRPRSVIEFGGDKIFTPAFVPSAECPINCSFVSGEAASMFVPFYAFSIVMPYASAPLLVAGTIAGIGAGLVRVAQGGHFISDVIFAGVFMALTTSLIHHLMFRR